MKPNWGRTVGIAATLALAGGTTASAQITRIDIKVVESPTLDGRRFGQIGAYERLRGVAYGEVDPADARHQGIVNLEHAPRNEAGRVEYSTTVELYRPIDMTRWNRGIYHTVPNRGRAGDIDSALLERGLVLVWVGWQGDIASTDRNIVASLPIATRSDGSPITGRSLEEFIFNDSASVSQGALTYPAASRDPAQATLTVRRGQAAPRLTPPDLTWNYVGPAEIEITRPAKYDGGAIYEFVYQAKEPMVMGLGFAAMRDTISFLRYAKADSVGSPNPLNFDGLPDTAISLGISQSGRMLRDFLYQGFNEDLQGRMVFDGLHPNIAGSRKTFTNYLFGQPGRFQRQHADHVYPGDQFPFAYASLTDPISARTDGLLVRCSASNTCPKIIHSDGEAELWQARASLVVTDSVGHHIDLPENVRAYLIAGTKHGGGIGVHAGTPARGICQNLDNPLSLAGIRSALSVALYEWVAEGRLPPPSRYPTVANGGLVRPSDARFSDIPGGTYSGLYNPVRLHDHTRVPPTAGKAYAVLLPAVDADGNMTAGVRHPNLQVPIGTHTGWNLRRVGSSEGALCGGAGSFLPFPMNADDRETSGDPRRSIAERYPSHDVYVDAVSAAASRLVKDRFLLPADAKSIVKRARASRIGKPD